MHPVDGLLLHCSGAYDYALVMPENKTLETFTVVSLRRCDFAFFEHGKGGSSSYILVLKRSHLFRLLPPPLPGPSSSCRSCQEVVSAELFLPPPVSCLVYPLIFLLSVQFPGALAQVVADIPGL